MDTKAYACINNNEIVRRNSSSGGVYSLLAEKVISEGGYVFAAVYDEQFHVRHSKIAKIEDIDASRGAKYVYSDFSEAVKEAKELLGNNKVMFVGSPCQCAAMIAAAGENRENLLCVDFVCHGVPDVKTWDLYLLSLKKKGMNLASINMRCKETGWSNYNYCWKLVDDSGKVTIQKQDQNPYMIGFTKDYYLRNACYNCKHKGFSRPTDITLGDFWGIWNINLDMDDNKGTSLVLVHSEKGLVYFDSLKEQMKVYEATEEEAIRNNKSIVSSSKRNEKAELFAQGINNGEDFICLMNKLEKVSLLKKIKRKINSII